MDRCVMDGLHETHPTRAFAARHGDKAYLCFFNESQRGQARWGCEGKIVQVNRTEALDASRAIVRENKFTFPSRQEPLVEEFARHMASEPKTPRKTAASSRHTGESRGSAPRAGSRLLQSLQQVSPK